MIQAFPGAVFFSPSAGGFISSFEMEFSSKVGTEKITLLATKSFERATDAKAFMRTLVEVLNSKTIEDVNSEVKSEDHFQGYHQFTDSTGSPFGSFEVFYADKIVLDTLFEVNTKDAVGWYWWSCFSGSLPDSEPHGPFPTSEGAYLDAIGD